ncbi:MAG: orotate phosphoribosyltransferase [Saccharofermentans sp.]|nr:orotate phosphoribosyltransferase [Saccharofermentans sp.]
MSDTISEMLFETKALRMAPADTPFWYTSGMLGPFYINTHFLIENEACAGEVLKRIEKAINNDKLTAPEEIFDMMLAYYNKNGTFKKTMDILTGMAKELDFDYISGGERRDYFFSMIPAYLLGKPHLTIFKDMTFVYNEDLTKPGYVPSDLKGKKALHIADLVTEASSYERAWIPVIRGIGSEITDTLAVVNRCQNGEEVLNNLGVALHCATAINKDLFEEAESNGTITTEQKELVFKFLKSPADYMDEFIKSHPDFINEQIAMGGKNEQRAKLAIEKGFV